MFTRHKPKRSKQWLSQKKKGQAMVELALMGIFLGMLLAGAVDFGRAFYTSIIVTNMAGEGAAYAALFPDQDQDPSNPNNDKCSRIRPVPLERSIQERARKVAKERGLVVEAQDQSSAVITVTTSDATTNYGDTCQARCAGRTITVRITYTLNDLFLPNFLGIRQIPITKSASQTIMRNPGVSGVCPND